MAEKQANQTQRVSKREQSAVRSTRLETVLAYVGIGAIALSVLAFLLTLILAAVMPREQFAAANLKQIVWVAYYGLPIGFIALLTLVVTQARRRAKAQTR